jgi:hypothetical protein
MLIEAGMTGDTVLFVDYLARTRAIVTRFPDDWSAWSEYADNLHHWGPMIGVTNTEMRAALQRTVDLNPRLVPYLEHLLDASLGHDSAQAANVVEALTALGVYTRLSAELGHDASMGTRLALSAGAGLPVPLRDSFALAIAGSTDWLHRVFASTSLYTHGYPAAQIELNRRLLAVAPHDSLAGFTWEGMASAWAARGAWDSTLAAYQHAVSLGTRNISPVSLYAIAASGTWLGALDLARAVEQRAAAVKSLDRLLPGDATRRERAMLAWADGILAAHRRDLPELKEARARLQQSGANAAPFMERSLAGLELELRGARQAAAESLAVLDLAATDADISRYHDPYARSITHLAASQLMLEKGDTGRALKLLAWHEANIPASYEGIRSQIFAGLAYYGLARIEEAQGKDDLACEHYEQFLRRYDMPPPAHQYLVDNAKASLRKLSGQDDSPATN